MRLLVDESLQQSLAIDLVAEGHDAVHVVDIGMHGRPDSDILSRAFQEDRVIVTADTDFGTLLALSGAAGPSVILLRRGGRRVPERVRTVLTVLGLVAEHLRTGAVVTVDHEQIRVRLLPVER